MKILFAKHFLPLITLGTLFSCAAQPLHAQNKYRITELLPKDAKATKVVAMNNKGDAVIVVAKQYFLYHDGKMEEILALKGGNYHVRATNNKGDIVGDYSRTGRNSTAFLFHNGKCIFLNNPSGRDSHANGINDQGDIVGYMFVDAVVRHAFLYHDGKLQDLGTLGGDFSEAKSINNKGDIAGVSRYVGKHPWDERLSPFLYHDGKMQELLVTNAVVGEVIAVNDNGDVIGLGLLTNSKQYPANLLHAFFYHNGKWQNLITAGEDFSGARSINNRGDIVGLTYAQHSYSGPFFCTGGKILKMNALLPAKSGWKLSDAFFINDSGSIVGYGTHNGKKRAFLMQPIAPPAKEPTPKK